MNLDKQSTKSLSFKDGKPKLCEQTIKDLMLDQNIADTFIDNPAAEQYESLFYNARHMTEIVRHLRIQVQNIIQETRAWKTRNDVQSHHLKDKYSDYEGALFQYSIRQHYRLYKKALCEMHDYKNACHATMTIYFDRDNQATAF